MELFLCITQPYISAMIKIKRMAKKFLYKCIKSSNNEIVKNCDVVQNGNLNTFSKKTIWQQSSIYRAFQKLNSEHPSFAFRSVIQEMLSLVVILK